MSKTEPKAHTKTPDSNDLNLDTVISKASSLASEFLESDTKAQIADLTNEWAAEATKFIKRNPWASVLGAAAIGYYLGSTRNRGGGR